MREAGKGKAHRPALGVTSMAGHREQGSLQGVGVKLYSENEGESRQSVKQICILEILILLRKLPKV